MKKFSNSNIPTRLNNYQDPSILFFAIQNSTQIPPQQIRQLIHIGQWPHRPIHNIILRADTRQNGQGTSKLALNPEPDIGVDTVPDHARAAAVELELALDGVHHRLARLAHGDGLRADHHDQRRADGPGAGEERARVGQGAVDVGREEDGAAADVVERERELEVVDVEVEADEDDANFRVEELGVAGGDAAVVVWLQVAAEGGVGAADDGDVFGLEFLLDAGLAQDEDLALVLGEFEDAGDVDRGAVGGGEDLVLLLFCQFRCFSKDDVKGGNIN